MTATPTRIQVRRDTAANWTSQNPVLRSGEHGYETDTGYEKIGDGLTAWVALRYSSVSTILAGSVETDDKPALGAFTQTAGRTSTFGAPVLRDIVSALDAPFNCVGDAVDLGGASTVGTALTFSSNRLTPAMQGKTVVLPSGGATGDGFVTTLATYISPTSGTLTAAPTVDVSNVTAKIGTDNTTGLVALIAAIILYGFNAIIPPGNYLHTGRLDFSGLAGVKKGCGFTGAGGGSLNTTATAATSFWYAGTGPALMAASATSIQQLNLYGFSIRCLRLTGLTPVGSGATGAPSQPNPAANTFALYLDNLQHSAIEDIQVIGYQDGAGNSNNTSQGSGVCIVNQSSGHLYINRVHSRYFAGPAVGGQGSWGWRYGSWANGFGTASDDGDCHITTCAADNCTSPWHFVASSAFGGGAVEGATFTALKAVGLGAPNTSIGYQIDPGFNCTWENPHSEGFFTAFSIAGFGNVIVGYTASYGNASLGDGSSAINFTGSASGNIVEGGNWLGWTGGTPGAPSGSPGFDVPVIFGSGTSGNRVRTRSGLGRTVPGTQLVKYNGTTTNLYSDLASPIVGDAGSGQQAGVLTPDSRLPRGWTNLVLVNQTTYNRFVPTRPLSVVRIAFNVTVAATNDDPVDVGIYIVAANGTDLTKVASSGATTGKMNSLGVQAVPVVCNLLPGVTYYAAIAYPTPGGTAATIQAATFNSASNLSLFGATTGLAEGGVTAALFPLPATITPTWSSTSTLPILAVRES